MHSSGVRTARKMISRRKKLVITLLCVGSLCYAAVQIMHYHENFSPLQTLSSAENEAQRLLKFITSYHYQCNATLHSSNYSDWAICTEPDVGINTESAKIKTAYSVGPLPDYSFETQLLRNLSVQQFIFLHDSFAPTPPVLLQLNNTTIFRATLVPNDPSDFGRNSYDMHTMNSMMAKLKHRHVDLLKIESLQDMTISFEVLYFMVKDGIISRFQQLHVAMEIDKIDDDYLYGWYKTLYTLFHSGGFRLYHTAASSPLCLQVTMMESCRYFMSWLRNPGPRSFLLYPPAIDGSQEYEEQRLKDFLGLPKLQEDDIISVFLSSAATLPLFRQILMSGTEQCNILVFTPYHAHPLKAHVSASHIMCTIIPISQDESQITGPGNPAELTFRSERDPKLKGRSMNLVDVLAHYLSPKQTSIAYINLAHGTWHFMTPFLDSGALQKINQLVLITNIFKSSSGDSEKHAASVLRLEYSELQRILAYGMTMMEAVPAPEESLHFHNDGDWWRLTFIRKT